MHAQQIHSKASRGLQEAVQNAQDQGATTIRFVAQLLHGPDELALNSGSLAPGRDRSPQQRSCLLEVPHASSLRTGMLTRLLDSRQVRADEFVRSATRSVLAGGAAPPYFCADRGRRPDRASTACSILATSRSTSSRYNRPAVI